MVVYAFLTLPSYPLIILTISLAEKMLAHYANLYSTRSKKLSDHLLEQEKMQHATRVPLAARVVQETPVIFNPNTISLYDSGYLSNHLDSNKKKERQSNGKRVYAKKQFRPVKTVPVGLIPGLAFINSKSGEGCSLKELYAFVAENFIGFEIPEEKWKKSFRHTLCTDRDLYIKDQGGANWRFSSKSAFFHKFEAFRRKKPDIANYGLKNPDTWTCIINGTRGIPEVEKSQNKTHKSTLQRPIQQIVPLLMYQSWPGVMPFNPQQASYHPIEHQYLQQNATQGYLVYPEMVVEQESFNGEPHSNQDGYYTADGQFSFPSLGCLPQRYSIYPESVEEEGQFVLNDESSPQLYLPKEKGNQEEFVDDWSQESQAAEFHEQKLSVKGPGFFDEFFADLDLSDYI